MTECKCGCGGMVYDGQTFLLGHNLKWKAIQKKNNYVQPVRSGGPARQDRTKGGPLKAYQDQVITQGSGGIRLCIIKDPDPEQNKPKQPGSIKEITEELLQKEEVGDDTEVLLEDMIRATREKEGHEPYPSVLPVPAARGISDDRTQTRRGFTRLKALIIIFLLSVVTVASYFYINGGV
jgi:hypothetical protein